MPLLARNVQAPLPRFAAARKTEAPKIVRLVLDGPPKPDCAEQIFSDALGRWPAGGRARYLLTPGGFAEADWPEELTDKAYEGEGGWLAADSDIQPLVSSARSKLSQVVTPAVLKAARGKVDYISVGIDVLGERGLKGPHAELVAVVDVETGQVAGWTGKSYPTASQENRLVPVNDIGSHLMRLGKDRVMVLGCNDLNMFSPRVAANQKSGSPRAIRCKQMRDAADAFSPTIILQHPHATDTPNIWRMAWVSLARMFPAVEAWASGIRYFNPSGDNRKPLEKVLAQTRSDDTQVQELVIDTAQYQSAPSRYMNRLEKF